jgi:ribosome-associated protein
MTDAAYLRINAALTLPRAELDFKATRAGGPGGQHVNTSSTRIELTWNVAESPSIDDAQRALLLERLATRLDSRGVLRLVSAEARSQLQNREAVVTRLVRVLQDALRAVKPRRPTKPTRASVVRRLDTKRKRSSRKTDRRPPRDDE